MSHNIHKNIITGDARTYKQMRGQSSRLMPRLKTIPKILVEHLDLFVLGLTVLTDNNRDVALHMPPLQGTGS